MLFRGTFGIVTDLHGGVGMDDQSLLMLPKSAFAAHQFRQDRNFAGCAGDWSWLSILREKRRGNACVFVDLDLPSRSYMGITAKARADVRICKGIATHGLETMAKRGEFIVFFHQEVGLCGKVY
jgi:hypothetical protein